MTRTFIQLPQFQKKWDELGFDEDDLRLLEEELLLCPQKGDVMAGTNGLRKIRIAFPNRSKSESARVCYVDFVAYETIYLITAYSKSEKSNLSKRERNDIAVAIKRLEEILKIKNAGKSKG